MGNRVEFVYELYSDDDEAPVQDLIEFFQSAGLPSARRPQRVAVKSWANAIHIVLTVTGTWAAERYVLNPLADRFQHWRQAVKGARRPLSLLVRFNEAGENFSVEIGRTSDPSVLVQAWQYVGQATDIRQAALEQGIRLDKIRLLPDGTKAMLVLAYVGNRPEYVVDLSQLTWKRIEQSCATQDAEGELWTLSALIRRLNYMKYLVQEGQGISMDEMHEVERAIGEIKRRLVGYCEAR
jgi:hypothetical protein